METNVVSGEFWFKNRLYRHISVRKDDSLEFPVGDWTVTALCEPRLRQIRPERVANAVKPFEDQVAYVKGTKLRKYFKDNIVANGTTYQLLSPKALFAALRAQQDLQDTTRTIPTVWSFPATPDEVYDNNTLHCHTLTVALCAGEQMESLKHDCRLRSSASRHACWNVSA
jgi:hypothetical protein